MFLKHLKIDSFGAFANRAIGPFTPGLNVVFGKNEAGKTTISACVKGILFGWEEARGGRNTYKPKNAERAGTLFFQNAETGEEAELSRIRNADGLLGHTELVEDIDKDTFLNTFFITSEELRSLKKTGDLTARLLTAGSGTGVSPAQVMNDLEVRIASYTSRAAEHTHSLVRLEQQEQEIKEELQKAEAETKTLKAENREFSELSSQKEELERSRKRLDSEIEGLTAQKTELAGILRHEEELLQSKKQVEDEQKKLTVETSSYQSKYGQGPLSLAESEEAYIREKIDTLLEEGLRVEHRRDNAKETYQASQASYEAYLAASSFEEREKRERRQRGVQIGLSISLPVIFVAFGLFVFVHGREINSLSFMALGIGLILFALLISVGALVMLFRPNKDEDIRLQEKSKIEWVMLQDKKKYELCSEDLAAHKKLVNKYLEDSQLGEAQGSLRRARLLLDGEKEKRTQVGLFSQRKQSLRSQMSNIDQSLEELGRQRKILSVRIQKENNLSWEESLSITDIENLITRKTTQRNALNETIAAVNRRYGELQQVLGRARYSTRFDDLKLAHEQVKTQVRESLAEYAELLVAQKILESAIHSWESRKQPEVYRQASRLFSLMTEGAWVQVRMTSEGKLQAVDQVKTVQDPKRLSLGTCQQLYLSLRIALLMTADNVGKSIPVLADDILVHFDEDRRKGAAKALAELAQTRQVIFFTNHREIVGLMQKADSSTNVLEL